MTQSVIGFGDTIDIRAAEQAISQFSTERVPASEITLDFALCRRVDVGGGYRLGNLMRRLVQSTTLTIVIPDDSLSETGISPQFFLAFTRSGLGPAVARHATRVVSGTEDVTDSLKRYYLRTLATPGQNSIYVPDLHAGTLDVDNEPSFWRHVSNLMNSVNLQVASMDKDAVADVSALCFEAAQNVWDHAWKKPLAEGVQLLSYLALRYYKAIAKPAGQGALSGYLKRLKEQAGGKEPHWLEIVVNDDGNGIAARQSLDERIYWKPLDTEEEALLSALSHASVKLRSRDAKIRGGRVAEGFTRIRSALRELKAFASLRSGRCLATFDGTLPYESSFKLSQGDHQLPFGLMPGTALQLLIPLPHPAAPTDSPADAQSSLDLT